MDYEVICFTGPLATHTLTDGEGWVQKRHPLDALRRAGHDGNSVEAVKQAHVRRHRTSSTTYKAVPRIVDPCANVFKASGKGWRLMTKDHPNAHPCSSCLDGFLRPKEVARRYVTCRTCRGSQWR
jgi:hypothetical protein